MNIVCISASTKDELERKLKYEKDGNIFSQKPIYKDVCLFFRALRKIHSKLPIYGFEIWLSDWWKNLDKTDVIIAVAYQETYKIMKIIKKRFPNVRRILYWYDPVWKTISPNDVSEEFCERWTFSKSDAKKYNIRYNGQYWSNSLDVKYLELREQIEQKYDMFFIGSGTNGYDWRKDSLQFLDTFSNKNFFRLKYGKGKNDVYALEKPIVGEEYFKILVQSKCLVDLVDTQEPWMTLIPLEALFYKKKLISNNRELLEEPLYHPNNIFIIGYNDDSELIDWLDRPLFEFDKEILQYYSQERWIETFL